MTKRQHLDEPSGDTIERLRALKRQKKGDSGPPPPPPPPVSPSPPHQLGRPSRADELPFRPRNQWPQTNWGALGNAHPRISKYERLRRKREREAEEREEERERREEKRVVKEWADEKDREEWGGGGDRVWEDDGEDEEMTKRVMEEAVGEEVAWRAKDVEIEDVEENEWDEGEVPGVVMGEEEDDEDDEYD